MSPRLEDIRIDLARRLRPLLADMPQLEFDELVGRMASIQIKYESRRDRDFFGPQTSNR